MLSSKKLLQMARKWYKLAAMGRRRILFTKEDGDVASSNCKSAIADKGHVVLYTVEEKRFMIPVAYLNNSIFRELFRMSEEEYGLPSEGPIVLPCEAVFLEYVISLQGRRMSMDVERALLTSISSTSRCSEPYVDQLSHSKDQIVIYGF